MSEADDSVGFINRTIRWLQSFFGEDRQEIHTKWLLGIGPMKHPDETDAEFIERVKRGLEQDHE